MIIRNLYDTESSLLPPGDEELMSAVSGCSLELHNSDVIQCELRQNKASHQEQVSLMGIPILQISERLVESQNLMEGNLSGSLESLIH